MGGLDPGEKGRDVLAEAVVGPGHGFGLDRGGGVGGQGGVGLRQQGIAGQEGDVLLGLLHEDAHGVFQLADFLADGRDVQGHRVVIDGIENDSQHNGCGNGNDQNQLQHDLEFYGPHIPILCHGQIPADRPDVTFDHQLLHHRYSTRPPETQTLKRAYTNIHHVTIPSQA